MAAHYGTAILPARPRRPRDMAKVEQAVLIGRALADAEIAELLTRLNEERPIRRLGVNPPQAIGGDRPAGAQGLAGERRASAHERQPQAHDSAGATWHPAIGATRRLDHRAHPQGRRFDRAGCRAALCELILDERAHPTAARRCGGYAGDRHRRAHLTVRISIGVLHPLPGVPDLAYSVCFRVVRWQSRWQNLRKG
jgi:hypothetical protein